VKQSNVLLGGGTYVASQLAVAPPQPQACLGDRVLVAGRAGVWGTTDAGVDWYPMVRGLGLTISRDVIADPALAGRTYVATADWVFHYSVDELATVIQKKPPGGTAADVAIEGSTTPGRVYVAVASTSGNSGGEVFSSANPVTSGWTDEGLSSVAGGKRPLAIVVRKVGAQRILIAAVDGGGVWRKAGTTWTKVSGVAMAKNQPSRGAALVWPAGTNTVYLYDHETGVWRSNDAGRTWGKIWSKPSSFPATGYLAVDPVAPGRLFVSVGWTGVYRIDGATTGSVDAGTLTAQEVGDFAVPGPVEFDPAGDLYVAAGAAAGSPPGLFRSVDGGVGWVSVDDAAYDAAGGFPFDLAFAPDGTAFLSTNGDGVLVGVPT
jgi:hypothetical protein